MTAESLQTYSLSDCVFIVSCCPQTAKKKVDVQEVPRQILEVCSSALTN